eukprot:TRINITY_DN36766_c0_g1_i1.p1 TRINITY_DN36766_c0_g1~~TRINITY_DN36766_c0_g1_i1.p1  ORF type:complete len:3469 (-),score=466.77 TRINITY_DN36766_c0_g1_i1:385-10791(-)
MLRSQFGPVDLRRPRDKEVIKLAGTQTSVTITKQWLKDEGSKKTEAYQSHVKQAMLIAATKMEIADLTGIHAQGQLLPSGQQRTPQAIREMQQNLRRKFEAFRDGSQGIPLKRLNKADQVVKRSTVSEKHLLVKRSHKIGVTRTRYFTISNGKLSVFKHQRPHNKPTRVYQLQDGVDCRYENIKTPGTTEQFVNGYEDRVIIHCPERPHGPMYLYAKDAKQARSWHRAIVMSKYLVNPADREALAVVVGRVAGNICKKGWDSLVTYAKEIQSTKALVKHLSMRLTLVELSRGWNKVRLAYQQQVATESLREEQEKWAAHFLKEKMDRINSQPARSPQQVRRTIISQIQSKFRHFREERIIERLYPLGSTVSTRMQQALSGSLMGLCFRSVSNSDALQLNLSGRGSELLNTDDGMHVLQTRRSTYSEVNLPAGRSMVSVSDSLSMLSFSEIEEEAEHVNLAKADWAHFAIIEQISSVVLHSQRILSEGKGDSGELRPNVCHGTWFTLNGPRAGWCRTMQAHQDPTTMSTTRDAVGAMDACALPRKLASGQKVRLLRLTVLVTGAHAPPVPAVSSHHPTEEESEKKRSTYLVLYVLGRRFSTVGDRQTSEQPQYRCEVTAEAPLTDDDALAAFDEQDIFVEVVEYDEDPALHRTSWSGKIKLWKSFAPQVQAPTREWAGTALQTAQETLGIKEHEKEQIISLSHTLSGGSGKVEVTLPLVHAALPGEKQRGDGKIGLHIEARVMDASAEDRVCISPELQGRGPVTSLYTTHKGSWYDPCLGKNEFTPDHVANFVEFRLESLSFPASSQDDGARIFRYHIEAKCGGVSVASIPLHRPRSVWKSVVPSDPSRLDFKGSRLFLPLPPGAWCLEDEPPSVEFVVLRCPEQDSPTFTFRSFLDARGKPGNTAANLEKVFHGVLQFDGGVRGLAVDSLRSHFVISLTKAGDPRAVTGIGTGNVSASAGQQGASLTLDVALRDRDFARIAMSIAEDDQPQRLPNGIICVGDKAMLCVEEQLHYPSRDFDYRRRCFPGAYGDGRPGVAWAAPLRDPGMTYEWEMSGLERLEDAPVFKQKTIPMSCEDIIPYKYVCPPSEMQFREENRAGVFWRIIENTLKEGPGSPAGANVPARRPVGDSAPQPFVVSQLTHLQKKVPVTVLAVYANGTCDLEIAPTFMHDWERHPDRHYAIPGAVVIKEFEDTSLAYLRAAPTGTGDVGERQRRRVLLKNVSLVLLQSVQLASFNIYDASFGSVDDAIEVAPSSCRNDFNPRDIDFADHELFKDGQRCHRGGYSVSAGPVPADAGPSCQYEWSLHLHVPSDADMYHFITMLRQCVRMDLSQQIKKMREHRGKIAKRAAEAHTYRAGPPLSTATGNLEVVLVEARHLTPPKMMKTSMGEIVDKVKKASGAALNPFVQFTMFIDDKPMIYRGSKVQTAPTMQGTINPNWSQLADLRSSKGWAFKTQALDPAEMPKLSFELNVLHSGVGGVTSPIGSVRVPATEHATGDMGTKNVNLCDPASPFHSLWLPLYTTEQSETQGEPPVRKPNLSGEVHILTLWVPKQMTGEMKRRPKTARGYLNHEMWPKQLAAHIREPVYNLTLRCDGYNPNTTKDEEVPPSRADVVSQHTEKLVTSAPYHECCERLCQSMWASFFARTEAALIQDSAAPAEGRKWAKDFGEGGPPRSRLCELRQQNPAVVVDIDDLLRRGIPAAWRKEIWFDITNANSVMDQPPFKSDGRSSQYADQSPEVKSYQKLVEDGRPIRSDSMMQLNDDLVTAVSWETSTHAAVLDQHLQRLNRAQNVCIALIAFTQEDRGTTRIIHYRDDETGNQTGRELCGVAYCESLLMLAFMLLLPQVQTKDPRQVRDVVLAEQEAHAFWLLYTLISSPANQFLREYFGSPPGFPRSTVDEGRGQGDAHPLYERSGAMEDVLRLDKALARWERELWVHLHGIGFHLSMVFYPAFMRLFSLMIPTASLFRLWDLIFSQSTHPNLRNRPRRHTLIDTAYAAITQCRTTLLKCESVMEARDAIVGTLESWYDPTEMIQLVGSAEHYLWDGHLQAHSGVCMHTADFKRSLLLYDHYFDQFRIQNTVLREISKIAGGSSTTAQPQPDIRMTTKKVLPTVITPMLKALAQDSGGRGKYGGMFRRTPDRLLSDQPDQETSVLGTIWGMASRAATSLTSEPEKKPSMLAFGIPPPPETMGEPSNFEKASFNTLVTRVLGQSWEGILARVWDSFESRGEDPQTPRISLFEFFAAVIACSRGTVGDKALALFQFYGVYHGQSNLNHVHPVTQSTLAVTEKLDGGQDAELMMPPKADEVQALHFKVWTYCSSSAKSTGMQHEDGILLGEVCIPSLKPYFFTGMSSGNDTPHEFSIWGPPIKPAPGQQVDVETRNRPGNNARVVGTMSMSIRWIPSEGRPHVGQLCCRLVAIKFEERRVEAPNRKNPKVTLCTYDETKKPKQIPGWDPRGTFKRASSAMTFGVANGGAFGDVLFWEEPMRRDTFGNLHRRVGSQDDDGWDSSSGAWKWSQKWGEQHSTENFEMQEKFCESNKRANHISLQACRIITQGILNRTLATVSNRQAILIADHAFNRAGAVPGILDAILVQGQGDLRSKYRTPAELKADTSFKDWIDVKHQIVVAHERMVSVNKGNINLFSGANASGMSLGALQPQPIKDPFPGSPKSLWIRYTRSGDGERGQKIIEVDGSGSLVGDTEVNLEMQKEIRTWNQQMFISRDEFISCMLASPVLSEGLRQLSTAEQSRKDLPKGEPIKLDVMISDPTETAADEDFLDTVDANQGIMFEVWDKDPPPKSDFLGECWLPSLGEIGPHTKAFALILRNAGQADRGSRPDQQKNKSPALCTGELHVEASWKFPAEPPKPVDSGASLQDRAVQEAASHTGELKLKIVRASGLRLADKRLLGKPKSDPYVIAYVRNETYTNTNEGWRSNPMTNYHAELLRTNWKKATTNPVWEEEFKFQLQTGAFEKRSKAASMNFALTSRAQTRREQDASVQMLKDHDELRVHFGDQETGNKVNVYLGDTIRQFKVKLMRACRDEAEARKTEIASIEKGLRDLNSSAQMHSTEHSVEQIIAEKKQRLSTLEDTKAQFEAISKNMSFRHVVMVFVPSMELRKLFSGEARSPEYKRLYKLEEQDPSSWQPLDPTRTFNHYATSYGFGMPRPQRLRVSEGTDDYKLRNHRYKKFEQEQQRWGTTICHTNTKTTCYGYALYTHEEDGSKEWRPALLSRPTDSSGGFQASYAYFVPPKRMLGGGTARDRESVKDSDVLLAPMLPDILGSSCLQHHDFLQFAQGMYEQGKSEADIAKKLNEQIDIKFAGVQDVPKPPPITIGHVKHHLRSLAAASGSSALDLPTTMEAPSSGAPTSQQPAASVQSGMGVGLMSGSGPSGAGPAGQMGGPRGGGPGPAGPSSGFAGPAGPKMAGPRQGGGPPMGPSMGGGPRPGGRSGPGGAGPSMGPSGPAGPSMGPSGGR